MEHLMCLEIETSDFQSECFTRLPDRNVPIDLVHLT